MNDLRYVILLIVLITSYNAISKTTQSQLPQWQQQMTSKSGILQGDFQQSKSTPYLRRPLNSTGHLVVDSKQGLLWQTQTPIKSTLIFTNHAITSIDSQGRSKILSGVGELNLVFVNAIIGQWQQLEQYFHTEYQQDEQQHCVVLKPKSTLSETPIEQIKVCGDQKSIETITITETTQAHTEIRLNLKSTSPLTPKQQQLFDQVKSQQ